MTARNPIFLSHGAPSLLVDGSAANVFLKRWGATLAPPVAWVVVSAHWESSPVRVTSAPRPETIHDFRGFGPVLETFEYAAKGDPELANRIVRLIEAAGLAAMADPQRGLDHGVWVPLALMTPAPSAPVIQVSLPGRQAGEEDTATLGRALAPLARDGVQLVFSGSMTHSLRDALHAPVGAEPMSFAEDFAVWAREAIRTGDSDRLRAWRSAPQAARNHPTPEHFLPLIAAMNAGGGPGDQLHESWSHGALAMDVWDFPPQ